MATVTEVGPRLGIAPTCAALGLPRATYYRRRRPPRAPPRRRPLAAGAAATEGAAVLELLHAPRFVDLAPGGGLRDLARRGPLPLLRAHDVPHPGGASGGARAARSAPASRLRRPGAAGPPAQRALELGHHQAARPAKWTYFYLYVMLDVFSRYVVGWMVAHRESATLAEQFIRETCARQGIDRDQLTIHADRGPSMTSKPVAFLLADLGVTKTHSRPHVSNDNPFSEAQFKTLKYRPDFPERFGSIQDARAHCHVFFPWYNTEHHHSGLGLLTPHDVHFGLAEQRVRRGRPCSPRPTRPTPSVSRRASRAAGAPRGRVDQPPETSSGRGGSRTRGNSRRCP